ncbi:MAG: hypothetical protein WD768_11355 [Phycisphaeraceae bacterium]
MATPHLHPFSWERMIQAVELVRERALRTARALEGAEIPYAMVGGIAVAAWVARVAPAAVRTTNDVDVLLRREDMDRAKVAMKAAGFIYQHVNGMVVFIDGPGGTVRAAVKVVMANEKVREDDEAPAPDVSECERFEDYVVLNRDALVRMELTRYRIESRMLLRDMIDVDLVNALWCQRLPAELAGRLQQLLDTPDG